jgi:hypothetical protein
MSVILRSRLDLRGSAPMDRVEEHRCASENVNGRNPHLAERLIKPNLHLVGTNEEAFHRSHVSHHR